MAMTDPEMGAHERLDDIRTAVTALNNAVMNGEVTSNDIKRSLSRINLALALLADNLEEASDDDNR